MPIFAHKVGILALLLAAAISYDLITEARAETSSASKNQQPVQRGNPEDLLPMVIYFAFDSAAVNPRAKVNLADLAKVLYANKRDGYQSPLIVLEAHSDSDGSSDYNMELSMKRAESVKRLLLAGGVSANTVVVRAFGEYQPEPLDTKVKTQRRVVVKLQ